MSRLREISNESFELQNGKNHHALPPKVVQENFKEKALHLSIARITQENYCFKSCLFYFIHQMRKTLNQWFPFYSFFVRDLNDRKILRNHVKTFVSNL